MFVVSHSRHLRCMVMRPHTAATFNATLTQASGRKIMA